MSQELSVLHDELYELLVAFDKLCADSGVVYSLHGGTLIGAKRYGDFIPWDDDADVTMLSWDYVRISNYLSQHPEMGFRFVDTDGISCRFQRTMLDGHPMCWVDIIEYNYITAKKLGQKLKNGILILLYAMGQSKEHVKTATVAKHGHMKIIIYKALYGIGYLFGKNNALRAHRYVRRKWFQGNRQQIHRSNDQAGSLHYILPIGYYSKYERVKMHGYEFLITSHYNEMLSQCYGANWLVPPDEKDRVPHENTVRDVYKEIQSKFENGQK